MKKIIFIALAVSALSLISCEKKEPFDTQSPDDAPLILVPYETKTGQLSYTLANPDTPLKDSVVVTPSSYTTVKWYLDNELVHTGMKIDTCFLAGNYSLKIEAVTDAGKSTSRTGTVVVNPYPADPSSSAPAAGRHYVPGTASTLTGANLTKVTKIIVSRDLAGNDVVCSLDVTTADDATLTFDLPEMADGVYFIRFMDAEGKLYGADTFTAHNSSVVLAGYEEFVPGNEWTITGVKLENVASVKVDEIVITELTVTATSVTFTAPAAEVGEHTLSITNADGSNVYFITDAGMVTTVMTIVSAEITLWTGPVALKWDAERVKVTKDVMEQVPLNATIIVYFSKLPDGDENYYEGTEYKQYYALRITTPWWDGYDLVAQMDMGDTPSPFAFTYTEDCQTKVTTCGAMSLVGWGLQIEKITYK